MANLLRELHRKRICPISLVNLLPEPFQDVGKKRNSLEKRSILIAAALSACQECDLNDARQPRGHAEWKTGSRKGMGLNCAILINVARSTLHGHPSSAGSFNRVETFRVNYFPVELELHGQGKERGGDVFHTLDGEDRRTNGKREKKRFSRISNEKTR